MKRGAPRVCGRPGVAESRSGTPWLIAVSSACAAARTAAPAPLRDRSLGLPGIATGRGIRGDGVGTGRTRRDDVIDAVARGVGLALDDRSGRITSGRTFEGLGLGSDSTRAQSGESGGSENRETHDHVPNKPIDGSIALARCEHHDRLIRSSPAQFQHDFATNTLAITGIARDARNSMHAVSLSLRPTCEFEGR